MAHPLVDQLRFTRQEWLRALEGLSDEDARHRFLPMNCVSWMIGHLAWHEQRCWFMRGQGKTILPELDDLVGNGRPATTPPLADMWDAWNTVTSQSDPFLDRLTTETLLTVPGVDGRLGPQTMGTLLQRVTYHYWFHIGEALAIRQMLGQTNLPEFVGDLHIQAPYHPDPGA